MPDAAKPPAGLKVERTAAGGFRFDLPRPPRAIRGAITSTLILTAMTAGAAYLARDWAPGMSPGFLCAAAGYGAFLLFALYCVVGGCFGRNALEVNPDALVICRRLPLSAERRREVPLREVTAVKVNTVMSAGQEELWPHLVVKTERKEHIFGMGLERPAIEWIGARVAALADRARSPAGSGAPIEDGFDASVRAGRQVQDQPQPGHLAELAARELSVGEREEFGIQVSEQGPKVLRLRLAARGGRNLLVFGSIWTLCILAGLTVFILSRMGMIESSGGAPPPWPALALLLVGLAVGAGLLAAGVRARTLVEDLEVRPGEFRRQARSALGTKDESLSGSELQVSRHETYKENDRPIYHLRVTAPDGRCMKFAGNVRPDGQLWLMARITAVLNPDAATVPEDAD
jgi:hypothetical protein